MALSTHYTLHRVPTTGPNAGKLPLPAGTLFGGVLVTKAGTLRIHEGLDGSGDPIIPVFATPIRTNLILPIAIGQDCCLILAGGGEAVVLAN